MQGTGGRVGKTVHLPGCPLPPRRMRSSYAGQKCSCLAVSPANFGIGCVGHDLTGYPLPISHCCKGQWEWVGTPCSSAKLGKSARGDWFLRQLEELIQIAPCSGTKLVTGSDLAGNGHGSGPPAVLCAAESSTSPWRGCALLIWYICGDAMTSLQLHPGQGVVNWGPAPARGNGQDCLCRELMITLLMGWVIPPGERSGDVHPHERSCCQSVKCGRWMWPERYQTEKKAVWNEGGRTYCSVKIPMEV